MKAHELSRILLDLTTDEANELYDAISRVINPPTEEIRKRFVDQDCSIFRGIMKVLEEPKDKYENK